KNALANCCRRSPGVLISYMNKSTGQTRELIARVLGEVAKAELGDDMLILADNPLVEVRASAARALPAAPPARRQPALTAPAGDGARHGQGAGRRRGEADGDRLAAAVAR